MKINPNKLSSSKIESYGFRFDMRWEELTPNYRLCRKNGELVLQRLKLIFCNGIRKQEWVDVQTAEEN